MLGVPLKFVRVEVVLQLMNATLIILLLLVLSVRSSLSRVHDVGVEVHPHGRTGVTVCDCGDKRHACWSKGPSHVWVDNDSLQPHLDELWIFRPWSLVAVFTVSLFQPTSRPAHFSRHACRGRVRGY